MEWETALLRGSRLPLPVCAVLLAFATYADADGTSIRVSQSRVAEGLGATERTVRKWLGVGRDAGWIERTRESVGTGSADHYRLTIPEQTTGTSIPVPPEPTTGTLVPVLGADHRNERAEVPERTCTTTGTIVHDHRNDRSAYQPSCQRRVKTDPLASCESGPLSWC
ncbi:helix-turn-helix domain-containing protein, partial [Angustibacter sp. Root456]|uniref:helix-turn-helix domain-containing protein n=1 Tax=Angustibacter sp. Root456 TaxID=1736539 RepID=UPI001F47F6D7